MAKNTTSPAAKPSSLVETRVISCGDTTPIVFKK
jgi:hypothetical protein